MIIIKEALKNVPHPFFLPNYYLFSRNINLLNFFKGGAVNYLVKLNMSFFFLFDIS